MTSHETCTIAQTKWASENVPKLYAEWQDASRVANGKPTASDAGTFRSSHFDQPNILAHVRFNERTDADGKRVLFLEELQSDWAQEGRKGGFKKELTQDDKDTLAYVKGEVAKIRDQIAAIDPVLASLRDDPDLGNRARNFARYGESLDPARASELSALVVDLSAWEAQLRRVTQEQQGGQPTAPFVTDTKAWVALALKRMIRYAAENGFDRVAWTTGEQQAARYDLSKQVDAVQLELGGILLVKPKGKAGWERVADGVTGANVADYVGKAAAEKLAEATPDRDGARTLRGLDLKVGGEWTQAFYGGADQKVRDAAGHVLLDAHGKERIAIVPQVANEILKKFGGGKVGEITVALPQKGEAEAVYVGPTYTVEQLEKFVHQKRTADDWPANYTGQHPVHNHRDEARHSVQRSSARKRVRRQC